MKKKDYYLVWNLAMLLVLGSCGGNSSTGTDSGAPAYSVLRLNQQPVELYDTYPATVRGAVDTEIRPRVSDTILEVYADKGTVVKAGQPLFRIDTPSAEMALRSAEADVNSAKTAVGTAEIDVERYRLLAEEGIVSGLRLRAYENAYQTALASLQQAEAGLKNAREVMGMAWLILKQSCAQRTPSAGRPLQACACRF